MFLNPWYGGEHPPTANGGVGLQNSQQGFPSQHSPLSSASHSPHNSPSPQRISLSQSSSSPSPSPTLLPRNSHLHTHFSYLNTPPSPLTVSCSSPHNSSSTTTSSSNTSSPILLRNNNISSNSLQQSPSHSPRVGSRSNFNSFHTPHSLQSSTLTRPSHNSPFHLGNGSVNNTPLPAHHHTLPIPSVNAAAKNQNASSFSSLTHDSYTTNNSSFSTSTPSVGGVGLQTLTLRPPYSTPPLHVLQNLLDDLQMKLRPGWTVHCTTDGRYFYCK